MTIHLTVEPDRPQAFDVFGTDAGPLDEAEVGGVDALSIAYERRCKAYFSRLSQALDMVPADDPELLQSRFPEVTRSAAPDELVVLDGELSQTLFDIYVCEGWAGVASIGEDIAKTGNVPASNDPPSAGTSVRVWPEAHSFYVFCRNLLALQVRDALQELELHCANGIVAQLSKSAVPLANAMFGELRLTRTDRSSLAMSSTGMPRAQRPSYTVGNRELLQTLVLAVGEAVRWRVKWAEQVQATAKAKANTPADRARSQDLEATAASYFTALNEGLRESFPLALLVVDQLKPGFNDWQLEDTLGATLWALQEQIDALGRGIDPGRSLTVETLGRPAWGAGRPPSLEQLQGMPVPAEGFEVRLATAALDRLDKDPGAFALVHDASLRALFRNGPLAKDSFEYIVAHHHLEAVAELVDRRAASEAQSERILKAISRSAAAFSLGLLVTPFAEAAPAVRTASGLLDLALVAHQVYSVVGQMAAFDLAIQQQLVDAAGIEGADLARIGEFISVREEYATQVGALFLFECLAAMAGGRWPLVRKALIVRGFRQDLITLLDLDDESWEG